jgi:hypothetical protein
MPPEAVKGFLLLIGISQFSASDIFHPDRLCRWPCLVKGDARVLARKLWRQGVKSTSSTRKARPLTPQLAQKQLAPGFKRSRAVLGGVPSELSEIIWG